MSTLKERCDQEAERFLGKEALDFGPDAGVRYAVTKEAVSALLFSVIQVERTAPKSALAPAVNAIVAGLLLASIASAGEPTITIGNINPKNTKRPESARAFVLKHHPAPAPSPLWPAPWPRFAWWPR